MEIGLYIPRGDSGDSLILNLLGQLTTSPDSSMKNTKQVDKDKDYMKETFGTTCLITEVGEADRILDLAKKRSISKRRFPEPPMDAWDI